jgi:hypothetical protein
MRPLSSISAKWRSATRPSRHNLPPWRKPASHLPKRWRPRCKPSKNEPRVELRAPLYRITGGVDLSQIDAIGPYGALQLIAEIGTDMTRWPTQKHFTSWLTLAPNNQVSGGRLLSSNTQPSANRAAAILRRAAMSLTRSNTALGACYRRLAYRLGAPKAITAIARKLAILVYRTLRGDIAYQDPGAAAYLQLYRTRLLNSLRRRARELGLSLIDRQTGEVLDHAVVPQPVSWERRRSSDCLAQVDRRDLKSNDRRACSHRSKVPVRPTAAVSHRPAPLASQKHLRRQSGQLVHPQHLNTARLAHVAGTAPALKRWLAHADRQGRAGHLSRARSCDNPHRHLHDVGQLWRGRLVPFTPTARR